MSDPGNIGCRHRQVLRAVADAQPAMVPDQVAVEEPLEIRVDTRPVSVTMRTPGHDEDLALGFLFSEDLIRSPADILKVLPSPAASGNRVDVFLHSPIDVARLTRHVFVSSSCGICGKASIEAVHQHFPPIESQMVVDATEVLALPQRLQNAQENFMRTGGLHAAALFDDAGRLLVVREDVGRHNAVDKVLGYGLTTGKLPFDRHILLVSGRASFEILQKALAARIPIVAAVSAPSSLAIEFADANNQTLIGFLREGRMNIYSGLDRVFFGK